MKRTGIVLVVLLTLLAIGFAGCGTTSTKGDAPPVDPFALDLSALQVRNENALAKQYDDHLIILPDYPGVDFSTFSRVTIKADYFDANGELLKPNDDMVFVTLVYNPEGDLRGPPDGAGPNTPLKAFNVGGPQGTISTDRGSRIALKQAPGAILFQNNSTSVKYIELTEVIFHD